MQNERPNKALHWTSLPAAVNSCGRFQSGREASEFGRWRRAARDANGRAELKLKRFVGLTN